MNIIVSVTAALIGGFAFGVLFWSVVTDPDLFNYEEEEE